MASAPTQVNRRNAVRFELEGNLEMDRLQFSRKILQEELGFLPVQLDYLFAFPGKRVFEVVFATFNLFEQCLERFRVKCVNNPRLDKISITPLSERDARTVTVIMYSEKVTTEDIQTWISNHCSVQKGIEMRDQDGVRTGARRFYVKLRREETNGQLRHLPSTIQLGAVRGHVFYQGQPKECRRCGSLGHLVADCNVTFCRNCKSANHATRDCDQARSCNLCGSNTHSFRGCPQSYANKTRRLDHYQADDCLAADPPPPEVIQPTPEAQQDQPAQQEATSTMQPNQQAETAVGNTPGPTSKTTRLDWSEDPADISGDEDNSRLPSNCPAWATDSQDTQIDLPAAQHPAPANSTAISARDCRDLLDTLMAALPVTPELPSDASDSGAREKESDRPTKPPSLLLDSSSEQQTAPQKRQQQESSGESLLMGAQVWPSPTSTSASFLETENLLAFSSATQMREAEGESIWQQRPPRKKKKDGKRGKFCPDSLPPSPS